MIRGPARSIFVTYYVTQAIDFRDTYALVINASDIYIYFAP